MILFPELGRKHANFFLKYLTHVLWIRISHHFCNLIQLQPGDELTTIHYASTISGDDDFTPVEIDTFTVTENTTFEETEMGDGQFLMLFEMVDLKNESVYSDPIIFTVTNGEIEAEL